MGIYSIIDNRADNSLFIVSTDFKKHIDIQNHNYNKVELCCSKVGLNELYTSYKIINKWMGRVYIFKIHGTINHPYSKDISVSLKYKGKLGNTTPVFVSRENSALLESLNNDQELINICKDIDFEKLDITYDSSSEKWNIEIWPNFGDFIWMLIPPLRYMRRPKAIEIDNTYKVIERFSLMISNLKN